MIINYGAFVSQTLDKNYLPITLKYLELYSLTYGMDDILEELSANTNKVFTKKGSGKKFSIIAESDILIENDIIEIDTFEILNGEYLTEQPKFQNDPTSYNPPETKNTTTTFTSPSQPKPIHSPTPTLDKKEKAPETDIGILDRGVISIEPTWIKIKYGDNSFIFGVKVLPVYIKNDDVIIKDIISDSKNGIIKSLSKGLYRSLMRCGSKIQKKTYGNLPLLGALPPEGIKVKNQIVTASSSIGRNLYLLLNKNNISSELLNDAKSMNKMHKMLGWCSMIFADDVNQQAYFCMRVNHGMCSMVPYRVLIYSAGKHTGNAYSEIDEIQNAVSSVFKIKAGRITKILGEMKVADKILGVQQYITESYLQENAQKYLSNPDLAIDMFKKIRFISKMSNIEEIRKKLSNFPFETVDSIMPFIKKNSFDFDKLVKFSETVLKNSISIDIFENDLKIISYILAYRNSNMRGPNQITRLREILKEFMVYYRKNVKLKIDLKVVLFRTTIDVFNASTSILRYHDLSDDIARQDIIVKNLYVFLSLVPLLIINK